MLKDFDDWLQFYNHLKPIPAMRDICNQGGRFLHWIGYRSEELPKIGEDFTYLGYNQSLTIDGWRPKQPNAKVGNQCLVSYLGLEPDASWYILFFI